MFPARKLSFFHCFGDLDHLCDIGINGQVTRDMAKQLSEWLGKILQYSESLSINTQDTSISCYRQLEAAIPPSQISALYSGDFVGVVADAQDCKIELKSIYSSTINDHEASKKEQDRFKDMPVIRKLDNAAVQRNYLQIKQDVEDIFQSEMERVQTD